MFSESGEFKSTVQRVDSQQDAHDNQSKTSSLFMEAMSGASPFVTRTAFESPAFLDTLPPALNDKPRWESQTPPALNDIPAWQNPVQPALDDRPNWQKQVSNPNGAPSWQAPAPVFGDSGQQRQQTPSPVFTGGLGGTGLGDSFPQTGTPGNGTPWKSSWGNVGAGGQFNPAPAPVDSGKPWRAGWGDVAPGFPSTPPVVSTDTTKGWTNNWGDGRSNFPPAQDQPTQPNNGGKWRSGWGDLPQNFPTNPGQPTQNGSPWRTTPTGFEPPASPGGVFRTGFETGSPIHTSRPSPWGGASDAQAPAPTPTSFPIPSFPSRPDAPSFPTRQDSPTFPAPAQGRTDSPAFPVPTRNDSSSLHPTIPRPGEIPSFPSAPTRVGDTSNGGIKKPGDFFPGFPGGSIDNSGPKQGPGNVNHDTSTATREAAVNAFNHDMADRLQASFDTAVDTFKGLGRGNEVALEQMMRDWMGQQSSKNPITFMRGTAEIAAGLGEFRLEGGSRIDLTSHQDTKPRILEGYDMDFGGEAATFLRMSAGSLVAAEQYVAGHKGLVVDGQKMDDNYNQQLRNLQSEVEAKLNVIYGAHDIDSVFTQVRGEVRSHAGDWQQGLVRLQHQLDGLRSNDNRFIAKSARDVALGYLAEADYMASQNNGEDANIMYQDANKYLGLSMQRDPNAPDNAALRQISVKMQDAITKARNNQWDDPFGNPFGIPKPADLVS